MKNEGIVSAGVVKTVGKDGCSLLVLLCHSLYFRFLCSVPLRSRAGVVKFDLFVFFPQAARWCVAWTQSWL